MFKGKINFSENDINNIIKLHNEGMYNKEIAGKYNVSISSISRIIQKSGLPSRHPLLTEERKNKARELYNSGMNLEQVGRELKMNGSTVRQVCEEVDIKIRDSSEIHTKYKLNKDYFKEIDSHEKAYYLGLIASDGSLHKNNLCISLQEGDKYIIESFNNAIDSDRQLRYVPMHLKNPNYKDQYSLIIVNRDFANNLRQWGIIENKSQYLQFPENLGSEFYSSFILGYMDGDGTINRSEKRISLVSTKSFCESLKEKVETILNIHCGVYRSKDNENIKSFQIAGGRQVKKFLDWIYKDSPVYLYRKYEIYRSIYCV